MPKKKTYSSYLEFKIAKHPEQLLDRLKDALCERTGIPVDAEGYQCLHRFGEDPLTGIIRIRKAFNFPFEGKKSIENAIKEHYEKEGFYTNSDRGFLLVGKKGYKSPTGTIGDYKIAIFEHEYFFGVMVTPPGDYFAP